VTGGSARATVNSMRIVQDPADSSILYVYLDVCRPATTVQLDEGTLVDLDEDGRLVGVEVIDWERPWPLDAVAEYGLSAGQVRVLRAWSR
jgi:uncharacterized protein YuzE